MKKNWIPALIIGLAAAGLLLPQSTNRAKEKSTPAAAPLITFVELGSVNCIPCKMMQPVMKNIEEKYKGKVKVVFHDVWTKDGQKYGEQYRIRVIPTQVFLDKDGKEFFRHEGFFPENDIIKLLSDRGVR